MAERKRKVKLRWSERWKDGREELKVVAGKK